MSRARRWSLFACVAMLFALLGFIAMLGRRWAEHDRRPGPPESQTPTLPPLAQIPFPGVVFIHAIAFTPDGKHLVVAGRVRNQDRWRWVTRVWDIEGARSIHDLPPDESGSCQAVAISPDGNSVAVGGWLDSDKEPSGVVRVWDSQTGKPRWSASLRHGVLCLAWSPDGSHLAAGNNYDGTVSIWNADGKNERIAWKPSRTGEGGSVSGLTWSRDGKRLVHTSSGVARLWEVDSGREVAVAIPHSYFRERAKEKARAVAEHNSERDYEPTAFAFALDDRSMFVAGRWEGDVLTQQGTGDVWVWDLGSNRESRSLARGPGAVRGLALGTTGNLLVTFSSEARTPSERKLVARGWDIATDRELWAAAVPGTGLPAFALSANGKRLALASRSPDSELWAVNIYDVPLAP